jgi:hypothetical protein
MSQGRDALGELLGAQQLAADRTRQQRIDALTGARRPS